MNRDQDSPEIIEYEVHTTPSGRVSARRRSLARSAGAAAMSLTIRTANAGAAVAGGAFRSAVRTRAGRMLSDAAQGARESLAANRPIDWDLAEQRAEEQLGRIVAAIAPAVVRAIEPAELVKLIDINAVLAEVDVNALLDRIDVGALLDRVDVDELLTRVDVRALAQRAEIGELVAESTGQLAGSALDVGRRQAVALDTLLARTVNRLLGRDSEAMPAGPPALVDEHGEPA